MAKHAAGHCLPITLPCPTHRPSKPGIKLVYLGCLVMILQPPTAFPRGSPSGNVVEKHGPVESWPSMCRRQLGQAGRSNCDHPIRSPQGSLRLSVLPLGSREGGRSLLGRSCSHIRQTWYDRRYRSGVVRGALSCTCRKILDQCLAIPSK